MSLDSGASLGQLLLAFIAVLLGGGVTWGGLIQRVKTLEREVEALSGVAVTLATMKAELAHIKTGVEAITSSWLFRDPVAYDTIERPVGANTSRARKGGA